MLAAFMLLFFFPLNTQQTSTHFEFVSASHQYSLRSSAYFTPKGNQNQGFKFGGELVAGQAVGGTVGGGVVVRWIRKEEGRRLQLEKRVPEGKLCVRPTAEVNRALPAALHPTVVFTHGQ